MRRRDFARTAAALSAFGLPAATLFAAEKSSLLKKLGSPQPFDYAGLKGRARVLAGRPYQRPAGTLPAELKALDYDQYQATGYRDDHALWVDDGRRFRVKFFHLGLYYEVPVRMHELADGMAQELAYDPGVARLLAYQGAPMSETWCYQWAPLAAR
jgi:glucans biosynthesis protein